METVIEFVISYSIYEKLRIVQLFVNSPIGFLDVRSGGGQRSSGVLWAIALTMSDEYAPEARDLANVATLSQMQAHPVGAE